MQSFLISICFYKFSRPSNSRHVLTSYFQSIMTNLNGLKIIKGVLRFDWSKTISRGSWISTVGCARIQRQPTPPSSLSPPPESPRIPLILVHPRNPSPLLPIAAAAQIQSKSEPPASISIPARVGHLPVAELDTVSLPRNETHHRRLCLPNQPQPTGDLLPLSLSLAAGAPSPPLPSSCLPTRPQIDSTFSFSGHDQIRSGVPASAPSWTFLLLLHDHAAA